jgi:hypothetical protein
MIGRSVDTDGGRTSITRTSAFSSVPSGAWMAGA